MSKNKSVLVISDMHFPYAHPDTVPFLRQLKNTHKPDRVVCIGDEVDFNALSYHESDPDLDSAGAELEAAIEGLQPIYKLFPKVDVIDSNHGSMVYRKGKTAGIPRHALKSYRDVLCAPKGWKWHLDLTLKMSDRRKVYFHHSKGVNVVKVSQAMGMSCVQGHHHNDFNIGYWANPNDIYFGMMVGCLIDDKAMAFAYNKTTLKRPIIGSGLIINGQPKLAPMILDRRGRWTGKL